MRGMRGYGESARADEEGPHEVGGARLPDLPAAFAARYKAVIFSSLLHEASVQWLQFGSSEARYEELPILPYNHR